MIALGFHSVLLDIVETTTGSQWAAQVSESIELRLTYGLVISALLFLGVASVLKYLVPWQRVRALLLGYTFRYRCRNNQQRRCLVSINRLFQ